MKNNHLNGRGKTALRARVLVENELLRSSTRQQQPILLQDHQKKKRSHSGSNPVGDHKRLKVAQLEADQVLEIPPADPDPEESFSVPASNNGSADVLPSTHQSGRIAERTRHIAEQCWGNPRTNWSEDEEEEDVGGIMTPIPNGGGSEDNDVQGNGGDDENGEDEEDDGPFAESDVAGISAWDLFGENFEREAVSIVVGGIRSQSTLHLYTQGGGPSNRAYFQPTLQGFSK
ncbi:hypothetical protein BYT27DRAFT_7258382 [Phlegmacium glaucopus]|nr:hypothetical protein BYT27DRAFT_7258382 [Phlegmacium glaucopus]